MKDRLENALNEGRILMLGVQVLIGFDFRAVFEDGFPQLSPEMQQLKLVSLGLLIVALALLFAPLPYHWIAGRGRKIVALHHFTQVAIEWALLPFAVALSLDVLLASLRVVSAEAACVIAGSAFFLSLTFWYAIGYFQRKGNLMQTAETYPEIPLKDRVKEVLVETRIALPGVQALLGFQFIIVLAAGFDSLPIWLREVHLASLLCSAVCATLLIAPAAYHRVALRGEDTEGFVRYASVLLLCALVPLAFALAGDVMLVAWKVTQSLGFAVGTALTVLLFTLGFWFAYMYWRRGRLIAA